MCKVDLKDAYFVVPLESNSQEYVCFNWREKAYQFLCLCFGLAAAPLVFTKLMKVLIAVIRRLQGRVIIYLDDILLLAQTTEELSMLRDTLIYLLESLGFVINRKKSVLQPCQIIEFLGLVIDSKKLRVSLPSEKVEKIRVHCKTFLQQKNVSLRELAQLLGRMTASSIAVLPAPLHYRNIQQLQIRYVVKGEPYEHKVLFNSGGQSRVALVDSKFGLKRRLLSSIRPATGYHTDRCLQVGVGSSLPGSTSRGAVVRTGTGETYQCARIESSTASCIDFHRLTAIRLQMDNIAALAYILKMGGTANQEMKLISKELWEVLLRNRITIT